MDRWTFFMNWMFSRIYPVICPIIQKMVEHGSADIYVVFTMSLCMFKLKQTLLTLLFIGQYYFHQQ